MISHNIRKYGPAPVRTVWPPLVTTDDVEKHNKAGGLVPGDLIAYKTRTYPFERWADVSLILHFMNQKDVYKTGNRLETIRVIAMGSYQENDITKAWSRTEDPMYMRKVTQHEIETLEKLTGVSLDKVRRDCVAEAARRGFAYAGPSLDAASAAP